MTQNTIAINDSIIWIDHLTKHIIKHATQQTKKQHSRKFDNTQLLKWNIKLDLIQLIQEHHNAIDNINEYCSAKL